MAELTWILFLRILDEREAREQEQAEAVGAEFSPSLDSPYRWRDWAAPDGPKRQALQSGNLILHNIDEPHIWHGNTLTGPRPTAGFSPMRPRSST